MITLTQPDLTPSTLFAHKVHPQGNVLVASQVRVMEPAGQRNVNLMILNNLPASLILERPVQAIDTYTLWRLPSEAARLEEQGYAAEDHRTAFHQMLAQPWLYLAAALAGAAIGFRAHGRSRTDRLIFLGAGFAVTLYFVNSLLGSFGASGWIQPLVAGWFPAVTATALSAWLLLRADHA